MAKKRIKRRRRIEDFIGKLFLICVAVLIAVNILVPDRESSDTENRMLTQKPTLTLSSVVSGEYMKKYESYQSDQFAGRELFRSIKVTLSRLGGSKEENGVLIGKDEQLMEEITTPDSEQLTENLEAITSFTGRYADVPMNMVLVPDAATVLSDKLPSLATVADQNRMFTQVKNELGESVNWIDAAAVMNKHNDEKIYYQTDHHWTALGAYYTFEEAAKMLGITAEDFSSVYVSYPVSTTFNGALASKSGTRTGVQEEIDIYVPRDSEIEVVVNYVDEQRKTTSIYDSSKLGTKDQYAVYLGGNTSVIDIRTTADSERSLLLVKDSFANSFVQFLVPYFREIVLVDPRYYTGSMDSVMESYRITDAMFLYSGNTFMADNMISGVFGNE